MPTFEEIASSVKGSKIFTRLDASQAFWQVPLTEASSKLTTFQTPFGRHRFTRLPAGVKVASEVFDEIYAKIFGNIDNVVNYIDDILIHSETKQEHDLILKKVFERAR